MLWIRGGDVVDGARPRRRADVLVRGERVEAVVDGGLEGAPEGALVLEAGGLVVAPGLVDMHSHDDVAAQDPDVYEAKIRQGVTTAAVSMDGLGFAPLEPSSQASLLRYWRPVDGAPGSVGGSNLGAYAASLRGRLGLDLAIGVAHGNVRIATAGFALRPLTADELGRAVHDAQALAEEGAYGLSTGLGYVPALAADESELVAMARAVRAGGGRLYVTHMRDYGVAIFAALDEAAAVARRSGLGMHLSHLHLSHPDVLGLAPRLLERLEAIAATGVEVSYDTYPYDAGSSILYSYLPPWVADGGPDRLLDRLGEEAVLERLDVECRAPGHGWQAVVVASSGSGAFVGESVAQIAARLGLTPIRAMARLLREEDLDVAAIVHQTLAADDIQIAETAACVVGSDGIPYGQRRHPRYSGAFAAYYRRHVVERRAFGLEEAVLRMSLRPAALLGLGPHGPRVGARASLMVFDPGAYRDRSTFEAPRLPAEGVRHVLVGGGVVLRDGVFDAAVRPGVWLRRAT